MDCKEARRALMDRVASGAAPGLAEHLGACASCAEEWARDGEIWRSLGELGAPALGDAAGRRIRRTLSEAAEGQRGGIFGTVREPEPMGLGGWAVVAAAVILGAGAGGWLGLGARDLVSPEEQPVSAAQAALLDVADLVFDVAPPGSPAAYLFGGEGP